MKHLIKIIIGAILLCILLLIGPSIIWTYIWNHTYYLNIIDPNNRSGMLTDFNNWYLIIINILTALPVILYLIFTKKFNLGYFFIYLFIGLFINGTRIISLKIGDVPINKFMIFFNYLIIFGLSLISIISFTILGQIIKEYIFKLKDNNIGDIIISLGVGLSIFLLVNYFLISNNIFYASICWAILIILIILTIAKYSHLAEINEIISPLFESFQLKNIYNNKLSIIGLILILLSIVYYYYGFNASNIPYPTAWDANHAYLFFPKMRSYNHGYYWDEPNMQYTPTLWVCYIAYFFNLFVNFDNSFWISSDNIAVQMNFLSGIFVLIFGIILIREVLKFIDISKNKIQNTSIQISFYLGRFLILLWLTSGMGAFLVFVDNKTDLGVLSLVILAIYSGFIFLNQISSQEIDGDKHIYQISIYKYLLISGFIFGIASMAKQTSLLDMVNFGLLLVSLWIGFTSFTGFSSIIFGLLILQSFRGINDYFLPPDGNIYLYIGGGLILINLMIIIYYISLNKGNYLKNLKNYLVYLLYWGGSFLLVLLLFKLPFQLKNDQINQTSINFTAKIKRLLLSNSYTNQNQTLKTTENKINPYRLLTSTNTGILLPISTGYTQRECSLNSLNYQSSKDLYTNLKTIPGNAYQEDVGRYVGYGWKGGEFDAQRRIFPFRDPFWKSFFPLGNNTFKCYSWDKLAANLCEKQKEITNNNISVLYQLYQDKTFFNSYGYQFLKEFFALDFLSGANIKNTAATDINNFSSDQQNILADKFKKIKDYYENNSIYVRKTCIAHTNTAIDEDCDKYSNNSMNTGQIDYGTNIYLPYKVLIPFNITFNWSLQNLSSYYTDIGFIWLIILFFLIIGFIYGIITYNKKLIGIIGVTIYAWILWMFIGGAILWYGMGLIIWTILAFCAFIYYLLEDARNNIFHTNILNYIFLTLFIGFGIGQLILNLVRISSQGGEGPFVRYKQSQGRSNDVVDAFMEESTRKLPYKTPYKRQDVFNLQFSHYNKFIELANARTSNEGILLAGTYARYFIHNQYKVNPDQFLTWLWQQFSDGNVCASYLRMKDQHIKYIVIDPNIGTVAMGGGNATLFDRFFAKLNLNKNQIEQDGVISMLAKLVQANKIKYIYSNNLGAKYAYLLSDQELKYYLSGTTLSYDNDLNLLRSRMATLRFWANTNAELNLIAMIFYARLQNGDAIMDIADSMGKTISMPENDMKNLVLKIINSLINRSPLPDEFKKLSAEEKEVLSYYLQLYGLMQAPDKIEDLKNIMTNIIGQSIQGSSQIIVLEIN